MKRMSWRTSLIFAIGLILFWSCREPSSGCCDDSFAVNFDAEAEEATCCEYPNLAVVFNHLITISGSEDSLYNLLNLQDGFLYNSSNVQDSFKVVQLSWFINNLKLINEGEEIDLESTVQVLKKDGSEESYVENFTSLDFFGIRVGQMGDFRSSTFLEGIGFQVGWENASVDTSESVINTVSQLADAKDFGLITDGNDILQSNIILQRLRDSALFNIKIEGVLDVSFDGEMYTFERGFDRRVEINVDLDRLFLNLNINSDVLDMDALVKSNYTDEIFILDTIY